MNKLIILLDKFLGFIVCWEFVVGWFAGILFVISYVNLFLADLS